jgi:hypothetical protein
MQRWVLVVAKLPAATTCGEVVTPGNTRSHMMSPFNNTVYVVLSMDASFSFINVILAVGSLIRTPARTGVFHRYM